MTVKDQLKILDRKIKQNKSDYNLYRQNAEISFSAGDLDKYEYLTGKDLQYKPDPIQKAKFEYSSLGQVFNKGLKTDERSEGLLKRIKNLEDKADNQLLAIDNQGNRQLDLIDNMNNRRRLNIGFNNEELARLEKEIKEKENEIRNNRRSKKEEDRNKSIFHYRATDGNFFYFDYEKKFLNFAEDLYKGKITFDEAKEDQEKIKQSMN